ncbi:expressed unknown protein [Seminavis robusta]|uniref:SMP-30/Gluconolactonase/LRE-like region domain-containing protein n=1 Tax=Seminavis robusta TaxID=568900 RepID=A0A9N8EI04_9STRA|nr:expressed unknown protein [Seminavis robusta]|eukprot:Sro1166_g248220.1 n/a (341) ;mRNA; f:12690-13712
MIRLAPLFLVVLAASSPAYGAVSFVTPGNPESAVATSSAYYVGQMNRDGAAILKYDLEGNRDMSFTAPNFTNIRGLAMNGAGDTIWAAHDGAVAELEFVDQAQSSLRLKQLYNTSDYIAAPNGLCLSDDESTMFVTDPLANALLQIDFGDNNPTMTLVFRRQGLSPNGCVVQGNTVWMVHRTVAGITKYDISKSEVGNTEPFSLDTIVALTSTAQGPPSFGDGIVFWNGKLYVSVWEFSAAPPWNGTVFECDSTSTCEPFSVGSVAADMQLDLKTPDQPALILPNLFGQQVATLSLPPAAATEAPATAATEAPASAAISPAPLFVSSAVLLAGLAAFILH